MTWTGTRAAAAGGGGGSVDGRRMTGLELVAADGGALDADCEDVFAFRPHLCRAANYWTAPSRCGSV